MAFYIFAGIGLLVALQCPIRYAKGRKQNDKEMEYHSLQIASLNGHLCHIWRPACDLNGGQPRTH